MSTKWVNTGKLNATWYRNGNFKVFYLAKRACVDFSSFLWIFFMLSRSLFLLYIRLVLQPSLSLFIFADLPGSTEDVLGNH